MLQFMGSERVRHNWVTELNWTSGLNTAHATGNSWRQFVGRQLVCLLGTTHIQLTFFTYMQQSKICFYFNSIKSLNFTFLAYVTFPLSALDFILLSNRIATSHMWPFKLKFKYIKLPISLMWPVAALLNSNYRWLFATPQTVARQAPLSMGYSRQELERVAIPFSRGSSQTRDQTCVSCTAGRFLPIWTTREALGSSQTILSDRDALQSCFSKCDPSFSYISLN